MRKRRCIYLLELFIKIPGLKITFPYLCFLKSYVRLHFITKMKDLKQKSSAFQALKTPHWKSSIFQGFKLPYEPCLSPNPWARQWVLSIDSLVGVQEDDPDSLHGDLGVHGQDVDELLRHPKLALHQVPCNLTGRDRKQSNWWVTLATKNVILFWPKLKLLIK